MEEHTDAETFFVYKQAGTNDWGAIVSGSRIDKLPTCDFVVRVRARNETEAIHQANENYESHDFKLKLFVGIVGNLLAAGKEQQNIEQSAWSILNRVMKFYKEESLK